MVGIYIVEYFCGIFFGDCYILVDFRDNFVIIWFGKVGECDRDYCFKMVKDDIDDVGREWIESGDFIGWELRSCCLRGVGWRWEEFWYDFGVVEGRDWFGMFKFIYIVWIL